MARQDKSTLREFHQDWEAYLQHMEQPSTYGDNMTLQALTNQFDVHIFTFGSSRQGEIDRNLTILSGCNVPDTQLPVLLGHQYFNEHYESLEPSTSSKEN